MIKKIGSNLEMQSQNITPLKEYSKNRSSSKYQNRPYSLYKIEKKNLNFQIVRLKESVSESGTELLRLLLYTVTSSGLCNHVAQLGKCLEQILSQRFLQRHILRGEN